MTSISSTSDPVQVQEFTIKVPKTNQKRYNVMRFNGALDVDFSKWSKVSMERENNMKEYKGLDEDQPKFGAGSEFGREAKQEARRKKLGIIAKKYNADNQPWILKSHGSTVKKFKGVREGGISDNAAYYVFTQTENGAIEAYPLQEWYKFQPIQRYKALSAEEAELEFNRRSKQTNYFSLMLRKRLRGEEDAELDEDEEKDKKKKKEKELKISDMDEWMESSEGEDSGDEEQEKEDSDSDKKKTKNDPKKEKKKRDTDKEAFEDSDDGDEEGRELDYISDSSDSEPENVNLDGVSEEKALRKLLNSDDETDEEDKSDKDQNNETEDKEKEEQNNENNDDKGKKKKKKKVKKDTKKDAKKESKLEDDFTSDSSCDEESTKKKEKDKGENNPSSANISKSASPTEKKRKPTIEAIAGPSVKRSKVELPSFSSLSTNESCITEDAVRKYLMRKPMTATELVQKFKSKKTGLSSDQLVNIMTEVLKKIDPFKQTLRGKMYLSIKS